MEYCRCSIAGGGEESIEGSIRGTYSIYTHTAVVGEQGGGGAEGGAISLREDLKCNKKS